jgi:hypothetical protein
MAEWRRKYPRKAKFAGQCSMCGESFPTGADIAWSPGRKADHWDCYIRGHAEKRGKDEYRLPENIIRSAPARPGISDRARQDLEALKRARRT